MLLWVEVGVEGALGHGIVGFANELVCVVIADVDAQAALGVVAAPDVTRGERGTVRSFVGDVVLPHDVVPEGLGFDVECLCVSVGGLLRHSRYR